MKPGWKTTEFWITILMGALTMFLEQLGASDIAVGGSGIGTGIAGAAYNVARGNVKAANGKS